MNTVRYQSGPIAAISLIEAQYQSHVFKPHYHLDYHIGLIAHGEQIFYCKGSKHQVGPGFIQVMMPDQVHDSQTLAHQGFSTRIFNLSTAWLVALAKELGSKADLPAMQHCIADHQLYQQLLAMHVQLNDKHISQLAQDSWPLEIFSKLLHRYADIKAEDSRVIGSKHIRQLRDYLMAYLSQKIHLSDLARLCQLSESQLLRQFKRASGMTPYAWLARLRLEQAMILLKQGESSTKVAYRVGFFDQAHFVNAFRQAYGLTPSQVHQI